MQEWAYDSGPDSSRFCFLPDGETFRLHFVDPAIKSLPLIQFAAFHEKVESQKADDWKNWPPEQTPALLESVSILTFGDLDGRVLKFKSIARPFKRVLCFQAKMCNVTARRKSWSTEEWDVPDFWSEGDYQAQVRGGWKRCNFID